MLKKIAFTLLFLSQLSFSQNIVFSDNINISLLTCGSGEDLYSAFGHSAFRVQDVNNNLDIVYNYGIFDFTDPNFYVNFAEGKLNYRLGWNGFNDFYAQYEWENRDVKQQILNLTTLQKKELVTFLQNNARPENAVYQYDFFYNNCATKIRSVLDEVFPNQIEFRGNHITTAFTFRELINNNVPHNTWANVGINIALGSVIDIKATTNEYQFLPKYVFDAFHNASINNIPLVKNTSMILDVDKSRVMNNSFLITSPLIVFSIVSILIIALTYNDYKRNKTNKILDFIVLFTTGTIGIVILLLWFTTNHTATVNNFNILWAFAPNLIIAFMFFSRKPKKWLSKYFSGLLLLLIIQGVLWLLKVEVFAYVLLPVFISLGVRYTYLIRYYKAM